MNTCFICGGVGAQKCHVKNRSEFGPAHPHDYYNIVYLCPTHHYQFFDNRRMAIVPSTQEFLLLHCVKFRRVELVKSLERVCIKDEYIQWKNRRIHTYLKAELRKLETRRYQ